MKKLLKVFTVSLFLCLALSNYAQQSTSPDFIENELEQYIEDALVSWNLPGVAVAIVKDGEVVMAKGFGLRHYQKTEMVDENTLFMIASNTKAFTGHALALLEYQDQCSLEDKLIKYVPDFAMNDPQLSGQVSLNDVLSHRLGLETFQGDFLYFYSDMSTEEVYEKFPKIVPTHGFRAEYGYCNVGYFWAGQAIESITGESWNSYIESNFLEPLGMNRTLMLSEGLAETENLAAAHTLQNGELTVFPHTNIDLIGPAASMSSSVADLSHWLIAQLDSGRYQGKQLIPFEVIKETRKPLIVQGRAGHPYNRSHYSLYGLGWSMKDYEGYEIISHGGGILGFFTGVDLMPEIGLGLVVLTNSDENWFSDALKWEIIDAYLGLPFRNYSELYHKIYQNRQESKADKIAQYQDTIAMNYPPSLALDAYSGDYFNPIYGNIKIKKDGENLIIEFEHHPDLKATLEHINDDRFLCSYYPSRMGTEVFPFAVNNGKVEAVSIKVADRLDRGRYEFVKIL